MGKKVKISDSVSKEPALVIYDQLMLTPGIWNGIKFSRNEIKSGIENTDWTNPENFALINYHPKQLSNGRSEIPLSTSWEGYFDKISYKTLDDGVDKEGMYGDLYIYDPILASKLISGKSPLAVSIDANYSPSPYGASRLGFTNTALVYRPGCKDAYIQLEDNQDNHTMRIICEEDICLNVKEEGEITSSSSAGSELGCKGNQKIVPIKKKKKLEYELSPDQVVQVYNGTEKVFEGSVLSFEEMDGTVYVSIITPTEEISKFPIDGSHFFLPIIPPIEESHTEEQFEEKEQLAQVTDMETVRKEKGMDVDEFYAIPRDPPSESKLPIFDAEHTRNAMARFNQIKDVSAEEKSKAKSKIISAAKKFGIEIKDFAKLEEIDKTQLEDIYKSKKEDLKLEMESNNFETRLSTLEEQIKGILLEKTPEIEKSEEEVKEEKSEITESEEILEDTKEEVIEETKEEPAEVPEKETEDVEKSEVVETVKEESNELDELESLKSQLAEKDVKIAEMEAKLSESKEVTESAQLEEKEVAKSKTSVQLDGVEELDKPQFKNGFEEALFNLNKH